MPWSKDEYPDSMNNLDEDVREKAIDIANTLVQDEGYSEGRAIAIAQAQAKRAVKGGQSPKGGGAGGSGGKEWHVVPHEGGWGIHTAGADNPAETFDTKQPAVDAAVDHASGPDATVVIHGEDGSIQEGWDV